MHSGGKDTSITEPNFIDHRISGSVKSCMDQAKFRPKCRPKRACSHTGHCISLFCVMCPYTSPCVVVHTVPSHKQTQPHSNIITIRPCGPKMIFQASRSSRLRFQHLKSLVHHIITRTYTVSRKRRAERLLLGRLPCLLYYLCLTK